MPGMAGVLLSRRRGGLGISWFSDAAYSDLAAVADFNNDRYALPALGAEKITNGTFDTNTSGWSQIGTGGTFTAVGGTGQLTSGTSPGIRQSLLTVSGVLYEIRFTATRTAGAAGVFGSFNGSFPSINAAGVENVYYREGTGATLSFDLGISGDASTTTVQFDNVSIKEVLLDGTKRTATFAEMFSLQASHATPGGARTYDTGQAVGLGPELGANGDFTSDPFNASQDVVQNGWAWHTNGGTSSKAWAGGAITLTGDGTNTVYAYQTITTIPGGRYQVQLDALNNTMAIGIGTSPSASNVAIFSPVTGAAQVYSFTATAATTYISLLKSSANTVTVDNVSVKRITGGIQSDLAANTPRLTYANGKRQLRLEDARTQLLTVTNWSGGATNTAPTNWTTGDVGTTHSPATSIYGSGDNAYTFTASASRPFLAQTTPSLAVSSTYTFSVLVEANPDSRQIGEIVGIVNGPTGYTISYPLVGTTVPVAGQRISICITTSTTAGTCQVRVGCGTSSAQTGVVTLSRPQFELGAFASDYIPNTAASVTRAIETCRFSPLMEAIMQRAAASAVVRAQKLDAFPGGTPPLLGTVNPAVSHALLRANAADPPSLIVHEGATALTTSGTPPQAGWNAGSFGAGTAFDGTGRSVALNGGNLQSDANAAMDRSFGIYLARRGSVGSGGNTQYGSAYYDALLIAPTRLSDTRLQQLAVAA